MSEHMQMPALADDESMQGVDAKPSVKPNGKVSKIATFGGKRFVDGHPRIDIDNFGTDQGVKLGDTGYFIAKRGLTFTIVEATSTTCSGSVDDQNMDEVNKLAKKTVVIYTSGKAKR